MGKLTTHVLDTANGCPGAGMRVVLQRVHATHTDTLQTLTLNLDGRADQPLLEGPTMERGRFRLVFSVSAYFRLRGIDLPDPPFIDEVPLEFGIADTTSHYHVPLLVSPWSYSTYRGS